MKYHTNGQILLLYAQTKRGIKNVKMPEKKIKDFLDKYSLTTTIKPKEIKVCPNHTQRLQLLYGKGESLSIDRKYYLYAKKYCPNLELRISKKRNIICCGNKYPVVMLFQKGKIVGAIAPKAL